VSARGTIISTFSGGGGLDLGMECAGFDTLACFDTEKAARLTLKANRKDWFVPEDGDVSTAAKRITPTSLGLEAGQLDVLAGGPPCQPFSMAAQWTRTARLGMEDDRAQPVNGMLDLAASFLPKTIVIENVAGYLSGANSALAAIEARLRKINAATGASYRLRWDVLDAAAFGVPQHRKRVIAVAFRDGRGMSMPAPTHADRPMTAWDALHDYNELEPPATRGSWTALLPCIPEGENYQWLTAKGGGPELFGWRTRYWSFLLKLAKDRPSWTLPASPGPNTGPFHWDNRPLSVRERLRLQSFPDSWKLAGTERERYVIAGNATPPLLAEVIGRAVAAELGLGGLPNKPKLLRRRAGSTPPSRKPKALPARFLQLVGPRDAHPGAGQGPSPRAQGEDPAA
jgi:DNA (cytosine-5)-methyltransferase 1